MNEKAKLRRSIYALDFALHELVLYLDAHPMCKRALELVAEYRKMREDLIKEYEDKYGAYVVTPQDVPPNKKWQWLDGPWPWEIDFMEG